MKSFETFEQADQYCDRLYEVEKYEEAIQIMERILDQFPESQDVITWNLAVLYCMTEQHAKSLQMLQYGQEKGYFYDLTGDLFDPLKTDDSFAVLLAENERRLEQARGQMKYEVCIPEGYSPGEKAPLFFCLHGNSQNAHLTRNSWPPDTLLAEGFIVVYVQSSQPVASFGYTWTANYEQSVKDIQTCYQRVAESYTIDQDRVIIGGFSGGAMASIHTCLLDKLPARGFIALGPGKPEGFNQENLRKAAQRGVKGVVMWGQTEMEARGTDAMLELLSETGFPHQVIINPGIGHSFPDDLAEKTLSGIAFILS